LTLTQASAGSSGSTNTPTFSAAANLSITSSTAETITKSKVIGTFASAVAAAVNAATATITSSSQAQVQAGTLYTPGGTTVIQATAANALNSSSIGASVGAIGAMGIMTANSTLGSSVGDPEVQALLGSGASITAKDVAITSSSRDDVYADATSAAGGFLGSGAGARSSAATWQTVQSKLDANATINATGSVKISSTEDQTKEDGTSGGIDSRAFGLAVSTGVAGGGANTSVVVMSKATIDLGSSSSISAPSIDISSNNNVQKTLYSQSNDNSLGVLGNGKVFVAGQFGGSGLNSSTSIGNDSGDFGSSINLGTNSSLHALGNKATPGLLWLRARTGVFATDDITLDAVSAITAVTSESKVINKAKAIVNAASGSQIVNDSGDVSITAKADGTVSSSSSVLAGALGFGNSYTTATNDVANIITINGATIKGQTIKLWSGLDGNGVPDVLKSTADSQINSGFLGVPISRANATAVDTNAITITANSRLLARANLELKAQGKTWNGNNVTRSIADATSYILIAAPIKGERNVNDRTANTITIDSSSQLIAGAQHQIKVLTLPHTTNLANQNSYLGLTGSGSQQLTKSLTVNTKLDQSQLQALGLDGTLDYSYRLLASPSESNVDLSSFVGVIIPDLFWDTQSQRPYLDLINLGTNLATQARKLEDLIRDNDTSATNRAL
jgi:hypothetical protein